MSMVADKLGRLIIGLWTSKETKNDCCCGLDCGNR